MRNTRNGRRSFPARPHHRPAPSDKQNTISHEEETSVRERLVLQAKDNCWQAACCQDRQELRAAVSDRNGTTEVNLGTYERLFFCLEFFVFGDLAKSYGPHVAGGPVGLIPIRRPTERFLHRQLRRPTKNLLGQIGRQSERSGFRKRLARREFPA